MGQLCKTVILLILIPAIAYAGPRAVHIAIDDAGAKYSSSTVEGALQEITPGAHTTDTNANTICSGSTTYLDGEGNCDDISSVYQATGNYITALTGDVTASGPGSVAATIATGAVGADELASTAVTPGSYTSTNLTVDADGRITAASNGSGGGGTWGSITGTLSDQTDLQTALDVKVNDTGDTMTGDLTFNTATEGVILTGSAGTTKIYGRNAGTSHIGLTANAIYGDAGITYGAIGNISVDAYSASTSTIALTNSGAGVANVTIDGDTASAGDLTFTGTGDYLVGGNDYAFRYSADQDAGLYFNSSSAAYDFLTLTGTVAARIPIAGGVTATPFVSSSADPADAGAIRLGNTESIAWEASPAGTDVTLTVVSTEVLSSSAPISATTGFSIAGVAASGTILRGNGTNFVATTATYPNTATSGTLMRASGTNAWSETTSTYPATNAINTLLYASSANVMAALATANSGMLVTSSGGVPSISTTATMDANKFTIAASKGFPGFKEFFPQQGKVSHFSTGPAPAEISDGLKRWYALFDASADECIDFQGTIPTTYNTNQTLTLYIHYTMASASSGNIVWSVSWMATTVGDSADIETDSFDTVQTDTEAVAGAAGYLDEASITFTSTQADELTPRDFYTLRICRDADNGSDTATGDAELVSALLQWN